MKAVSTYAPLALQAVNAARAVRSLPPLPALPQRGYSLAEAPSALAASLGAGGLCDWWTIGPRYSTAALFLGAETNEAVARAWGTRVIEGEIVLPEAVLYWFIQAGLDDLPADSSLALREVNRARLSLGVSPKAELPAGRRNSATANPIALALGFGAVYPERVVLTDADTARRLATAWGTAALSDERGDEEGLGEDEPRGRPTPRLVVSPPPAIIEFLIAFNRGAVPALERRRPC